MSAARSEPVSGCSRKIDQPSNVLIFYQLTTQEHSQGLEWSMAAYPRYFQELDSGRVVAADDARRDSRTAEFTEGYLAPLGITSVLGVPILSEGRMLGVICHEHVGTMRRWSS